MKTYCALDCCRHHAVSSDEVGFVDFPSEAGALRRWLALTWVRHVVAGVTRLCTDHFLPEQLLPDPQWERQFPGQVNPNPHVQPGALPILGVPGWLDESDLKAEPEPTDPPSMFIRQEGSSARRVRPTARLREAHCELFDDLPPSPELRRPRGRPGRGRRGRPPDRRRPSPPPDLTDPQVRSRLVQQALDEYDWRQARAREAGVERAADGTETLYVSVASSDEEERRRGRGGTAVRSRRGRGVKRRRGAHAAGGERAGSDAEEPPLAHRLPPNTSQRFREVLAAQREVQALAKQLEALPADPSVAAGAAAEVATTEDGSLMVLRGGDSLTEPLPPEGDHYSTPTTLEGALGLLHQQRLENLRLRAGLLRAAITERQRSGQLAEARRQAAQAHSAFQDRLGHMFTPAQMKLIQNRSQRRTHMWDTEDVRRAIGLRRLCTRRAYAYVKDVLRVPLPGLAVLRGSSQRDPETALMYAQMVEVHRLKHMTKRSRRPTKGPPETRLTPAPVTAATNKHVDHEYMECAGNEEGEGLVVERAGGQSPSGEQLLLLVPGAGRQQPEEPPRPGYRLVVRGDGEVLTEDGRPLEQVSWPAGLQWMDAAQVNFADTAPE